MSDAPANSLLTEVDGGVLTLTLNRPDALNALTSDLRRQLRDALSEARKDDAIRAVLVSGAGRAFCAGADLKAGASERQFRAVLEAEYNPLIRTIRELPKPVLSAVNGVAAGAGVSLALAADIVIAADTASFAPAFHRIALVPDSGLARTLVRALGRHRAMAILTGADALAVGEAHALGLVAEVVPAGELPDAAKRWATRAAEGPTRTFGYTKRLLNAAEDDDLPASLAREAALQELAGRTGDHAEGVAAFTEKRAPRFTGQ